MKPACDFLFNRLGLPTPWILIYDDSILQLYLSSLVSVICDSVLINAQNQTTSLVVPTITYNTVTHFPQLTSATRQSLHSIRSSFRVFSLTESYTSNIAFNSHNISLQADLLYSSVDLVPIRSFSLRLTRTPLHSLRNYQPLTAC
jgi:hypothetical protein